MHPNIFLLVLVVTACAGSIAVATTPADATVKIMPLGDSITKGSVMTKEQARHPTYRYWLWTDLKKNGYDVDFVGSWRMPNFTTVTFDQDNEGHGGYTTDEILHGVPSDPWEPGYLSDWVQGYDYDAVLLLIGTNDVLHGLPTNESATNIGKIITVLRQKNPRVTVFLATLPPAGSYRQNLIDLNRAIMRIADERTTPESRVILVDQYYGYDGVGDNQPPEYVHPDESGEKKIAQNWYDAMTPYLRGGMPTPTPVPTTIPTAPPTPTPTVVTVQPVPTATATPAAAPITHGKHYTIGSPGSYLGTAFGAGGTATGSGGSGRAVATGTKLKPGSRAAGITPPGGKFVRWYPAARWAAGVQ